MGLLDALFGAREKPEERSLSFRISDPAFAEWLGIGQRSITGVDVSETSAFGVSGFWRCVHLISGTIGTLPFKTYRRNGDARERIDSWIDRPAGPYPITPFAWKQIVLTHLLVHGNAYLLHIYNGAGALIGTWPVHPSVVSVEWVGADKLFKVSVPGGQTKEYTTAQMTHVMGPSTDGLLGMSALSVFRHGIALGLAAEYAAGNTLGNGLMIAGFVAPESDITEDDAKVIKDGLKAKLTGIDNAGDIAVLNRVMKFNPVSMSNEDAQFMQSREFQVVEFGRWFGVPPHLLGATEKQTSWGTGVAEQNLGLQKFTLMLWTTPLEEALSDLLADDSFCEVDYKGLLQGTPAEEIKLLIEQVTNGILTADEARAILNLPPMTASQKADLRPLPSTSSEAA